MHSVCCCGLPVWRRSSLKKGTPVTYYGPAWDPHLGGSGRKTTTLVRDIEYFIHTKFHQNLSSGLEKKLTRGPKGHISYTWVQHAIFFRNWPRRTFFNDRPKKHKLGYMVEDVKILLPVKFLWIPFRGFRGKVENVSPNQRPGRPSLFSDQPEKHKLGRECCDLASCQISLNSISAVSEKSKMSQTIRGHGGHLVFLIRPKKHKLGYMVEDLGILLPVKFRWIPFSCFRREVENISANQRPGWPSCFSDRPENTNLVESVEILLSVKFRWILFSGFRGEVENVSANQRPGRPFCFSDRPKKHKYGRGRWNLASCQVSLNSIQRFQRRSRKCLSQSEARAAILFFGLTRKTQTW